MSGLVEEYFRQDQLPTIWCPGCGHGIVLAALVRAMDQVRVPRDRTVVVSGIGCSSRASGYLDFDTLHTTHGRAIAFATGVKLANPELTVIVITGDGDVAAIGGNHLIHAARRNIDLTVVCFDNNIYGMTSGQYSPITPQGDLASTAPYGNIDRPFDLCGLVREAGATYVARATTFHHNLLTEYIARGLRKKGFAFIDALSQCPTYYGRRNRRGSAAEMMRWFRDNAVTVRKAERMEPAELEGKIVIGEIYNGEAREYTELCGDIIRRAQGGEGR